MFNNRSATILFSLAFLFIVFKLIFSGQAMFSQPQLDVDDIHLEALEDYITENPDDVEMMHHLAYQYYQVGMLEQSSAMYGRIIDYAPDDREAYHRRGLVAVDQGQFDEARSYWSALLDFQMDEHIVHYNLSQLYTVLDHQEALNHAQQAVDIVEEQQMLGSTDTEMFTEWLETLKRFDETVGNDPVNAYHFLVHNIQNDRLTLAQLEEERITDYLFSTPGNGMTALHESLLITKGRLYVQFDDHDSAVEVFTQLIDVVPDVDDYYMLLADRLIWLGDQQLLGEWRERMDGAPVQNEIPMQLVDAWMLYWEGDHETAMEAVEQLADPASEHNVYPEMIVLHLAWMHDQDGDAEQALYYYQQFRQMEASDIDYQEAVMKDVNMAIYDLQIALGQI